MQASILKRLFLFKSYSWPNQIWSWGDGWLHFRETTPLRDPGSPRITNGFLIIFHHPILCLSLILPMIPETSRELHLNLRDQSWLRSSLSHTCLTALNTPCVHKACVCGDRRYTGSAHHHLTLSLPERPRSAAARRIPLRHLHLHNRLAPTPLFYKTFWSCACMANFFTYHSCISVSGGSTCRWWNLSSLKSWWAFSSLTWLQFSYLAAWGFSRIQLQQISLKCDPPL